MTRIGALAALGASAAALAGAKQQDFTAVLLLPGVAIAFVVLFTLPAALLLEGWRPGWIDATARAAGERKTACTLVGAGLVVAELVVFRALAGAGARAVVPLFLVAAAVWANFTVGFAGCARRQAERTLSRKDGRVRLLVLGWLQRSGAYAVPVLWPIVGIYLTVVAQGGPLVALLSRRRASATERGEGGAASP